MKRQIGILLMSITLGFIGAFCCGGWVVLLKPPMVRYQVSYWLFLYYGVCVSVAVRCLFYLCYERFMDSEITK